MRRHFALFCGIALSSWSCTSAPPSPKVACTADGGLVALASLVPDGGLTATGSRYVIPFANVAPTRRIFVAPTGDDTAAGTEAAPFKTLQAAFDATTPGTAMMIKAGTYTENLKLTHSGAAGAPIWLISADGPGQAKLLASNLSDSTVQGYAVHDLVLQGLDVTAPAPTSGDSDGIKFAANGDVSVPANQNSNLAVVDCTVHCASSGGYNGVKISTADAVFIIHDVLDGAGAEGNGDALDFVGNTNSEIAYTYSTNVPAHSAFQLKGGSTTVLFHDNLIAKVGGDGLWIGGGTIETYMHPSTSYEACNITANNNVMHDLGGSAVHFVGGQNSHVAHLFSYDAKNKYVQVESSRDHSPPIASLGNSLLNSVFKSNQDVLSSDALKAGGISVDPANDVALVEHADTSGHQTFQGGALITSGGGHDVYELTPGHGTTVISGFQVSSDVVHLNGYATTSYRALLDHAHQVGPAVFVDLSDGWLLVLDGVTLDSLSSANFTF